MPARYHAVDGTRYGFDTLGDILAKASPLRSGDQLAGIAATTEAQRVAARFVLADLPMSVFLDEAVIPYEDDDVTRLIIDQHDANAFAAIRSLTVGEFREWLLDVNTTATELTAARPGITPEMAAAASKIMRNQDLIIVAAKCQVTTAFRNTIGLPGCLSIRLQPNHPFDDLRGIAASTVDGLMYGAGDAVIGINPASDNVNQLGELLKLLDDIRDRYDIPTQTCVLTHVTNSLELIDQGAPVDLVFQSVAGTQAANSAFGITLQMLEQAHEAGRSLGRGTIGNNLMYFETGQGSALSADAHHGIDQQTCEARAYAVARHFDPLLVNTVVGFIGPEYLYDGKQIIRAGLEDHFCGKLLGLPMGCDVCYTNHAQADQDDMDNLLTLLSTARCSFFMGVPGADDIMLNYQSTSFHDGLSMRQLLAQRPAPEFERWLEKIGLMADGKMLSAPMNHPVTERCVKPDPQARSGGLQADAWADLRKLTDARIALGRAGTSLPTQAHLAFQRDHALARDAVHTPFLREPIAQLLTNSNIASLMVSSQASDRPLYLQRPDLGRQLKRADQDDLPLEQPDVVIVIGDGLSARASHEHAGPMACRLHTALTRRNLTVGTVVIAMGARVALADEIGQAMGASLTIILLGERPGLSSADSLGAYLTWHPQSGRVDAHRNCVSNIRPIGGLSYEVATHKLTYLALQANRLGISGVGLKDTSDGVALLA